MPSSDYSNNYLLYNAESTKNIVVAVEFEGLSTILTSSKLFKRNLYGDPGLVYGEPGLIYGGLRDYGDYKALLDLVGGSMTISQRLEPEQGRGAISMLTLSFIDLNQYMTQLCSPGVILEDILGHSVKIYLGYQEIGFPEDYLVIFRGRVSNYVSQAGKVSLQFSDPNMARRQQICYTPTTTLSLPISPSDTTINVTQNVDFYQQILGPASTYDSAVSTYLTVGSEVIEYPATGFGANQFTGCIRGARGTTAVAAASGQSVSCSVQIEDNAINLALKFMLSGWNGPYLTGLAIQNLGFTPDPLVSPQAGVILLPSNVDADRDYGISVGDYIAVSGAAASANNQTVIVLELVASGDVNNNCIVTTGNFSIETASLATFDVRSQYDTLPVSCGVKLPATEVDVKRHQDILATFLSSPENRLRFYITSSQSSCKTFLESQVYLPISCYSLTRFGRLSMNLTHAPIAGETLNFLNGTNVTNPDNIQPTRGVNNRKFFNEIDWEYDYLDDNSTPLTTVKTIDTNSLNVIGISSVLPISSLGSRTDLGSGNVIQRRANYLLSRYKNGAVLITIQTNWQTGCLIESGDVVAVQDDGVLQISNFVSGARNLGVQLFEVINRDLDIKNGTCKLLLVSGLGSEATDRYATISPSSVIQTGSTPTALRIADSYGAKFPGQEFLKWRDYAGVNILVHTLDYSTAVTATFAHLSAGNPNTLVVSDVGLPASALPGMVIDLDYYSMSTNPLDQAVVKAVHAFTAPQVAILAATGTTIFAVSASDIGKFEPKFPAIVHTQDWSSYSPEVSVLSVDTGANIITVSASLGFAPSAGYFVSLLGFADGQPAYRYI